MGHPSTVLSAVAEDALLTMTLSPCSSSTKHSSASVALSTALVLPLRDLATMAVHVFSAILRAGRFDSCHWG